MLNAEGPRGHQYADQFKYTASEIGAPFRYDRYSEALDEVKNIRPAVLIIDSISHAHDGPGGFLEWHEEELDRMVGDDHKRREKATWAAWVKPRAAETRFIYNLLSMECAVILCMRAKEKIKVVTGKPPIDLGWQPIVGERISFETLFTLMLPPHSKGVPDLSISDMREPFDKMVPADRPCDERLGAALATWSRGAMTAPPAATASSAPIEPEKLEELLTQGRFAAQGGTPSVQAWWANLTNAQRATLKGERENLKVLALAADREIETAKADWEATKQ